MAKALIPSSTRRMIAANSPEAFRQSFAFSACFELCGFVQPDLISGKTRSYHYSFLAVAPEIQVHQFFKLSGKYAPRRDSDNIDR